MEGYFSALSADVHTLWKAETTLQLVYATYFAGIPPIAKNWSALAQFRDRAIVVSGCTRPAHQATLCPCCTTSQIKNLCPCWPFLGFSIYLGELDALKPLVS